MHIINDKLMIQQQEVNVSTYWRIGLAHCVSNNGSFFIRKDKYLKILLFLGGLTLLKSSRVQLWSILDCFLVENSNVFTVSFFSSPGKPIDVNGYFFDLINELKNLFSDGIYMGSHRFKVELDCVIADAPAGAG